MCFQNSSKSSVEREANRTAVEFNDRSDDAEQQKSFDLLLRRQDVKFNLLANDKKF